MNSLFNCSWVQNTATLRESYITNLELLNEDIAKTLSNVKKKMAKLNIGESYRDSRLFFYQFLQDKMPEVIPSGYQQTSDLPKETAFNTIRTTFPEDLKIPRIGTEDGVSTYTAKAGGRQYRIKIKGDIKPGKMEIKDITPDNLDGVSVVISRKLYGKDINAMYNEIIANASDPTAIKEKIQKEFDKYSTELHEGSKDDRVTYFLNIIANPREYKGVRGQGLNPETGKRDLDTLETIRSAIHELPEDENPVFIPGENAFDTIQKNLAPNQPLLYVMPGVEGYEVFKTRKGNYEFRINLKDLGSEDTRVSEIKPENVGPVNVYDMSAPKQHIDEPPVEADVPARVYSGGDDVDFNKLPEEPEGTDYEPTDADEGVYGNEFDDDPDYRTSSAPRDWDDSEDEETLTPCVQGCRCQKCMNKKKQPAAPVQQVPEIVIRMSPQAISKQMQEAYRQKEQNKHRVDRRYGMGY